MIERTKLKNHVVAVAICPAPSVLTGVSIDQNGGQLTKTHAVRTYVQGIGFSRVGKRNWSFAGRIHDPKEVDTQCDTRDSSCVMGFVWDPEAEAGEEKEEGHERKGGEQKITPSESVDRVHGRKGKKKVNDAEPKTGPKSRHIGEVGLLEDGG